MAVSVTRSEDLQLSSHQHPRWIVLVVVLAICGHTVSLRDGYELNLFPSKQQIVVEN
jgi:hypothetical protein